MHQRGGSGLVQTYLPPHMLMNSTSTGLPQNSVLAPQAILRSPDKTSKFMTAANI